MKNMMRKYMERIGKEWKLGIYIGRSEGMKKI